MNEPLIPTIGIPEVAKICDVSCRTVRRWMKRGILRARKVGGQLRTALPWILEMQQPVSQEAESVERSNNDCETYRDTVRDLAVNYGIGPKVPRARMSAKG
jgi:transposase